LDALVAYSSTCAKEHGRDAVIAQVDAQLDRLDNAA